MGFNSHVMVNFVFKGKTVMITILELSPSLATLNSQDDYGRELTKEYDFRYDRMTEKKICGQLSLVYWGSQATSKVLGLRLDCCGCLHFNINTSAWMRNNKSYIRPVAYWMTLIIKNSALLSRTYKEWIFRILNKINFQILFLVVRVNEILLLVVCSSLQVVLQSFW